MSYEIEGQLLEVCPCDVLCPCWIGEDPDLGTCDAVNSYHIERGRIDGVDVSGDGAQRNSGRVPLRRLTSFDRQAKPL
jgi:hypothetical protein